MNELPVASYFDEGIEEWVDGPGDPNYWFAIECKIASHLKDIQELIVELRKGEAVSGQRQIMLNKKLNVLRKAISSDINNKYKELCNE